MPVASSLPYTASTQLFAGQAVVAASQIVDYRLPGTHIYLPDNGRDPDITAQAISQSQIPALNNSPEPH